MIGIPPTGAPISSRHGYAGEPSDDAGTGAVDVDQPVSKDRNARSPHEAVDRKAGLRRRYADLLVLIRSEKNARKTIDREGRADRGDARDGARAALEEYRRRESAHRARNALGG